MTKREILNILVASIGEYPSSIVWENLRKLINELAVEAEESAPPAPGPDDNPGIAYALWATFDAMPPGSELILRRDPA